MCFFPRYSSVSHPCGARYASRGKGVIIQYHFAITVQRYNKYLIYARNMLYNIKIKRGVYDSHTLPDAHFFRSALYCSTVLTVICDTVSPFVTYCDEVVTTRDTLQEDKPKRIPKAVAIEPTRYTIARFTRSLIPRIRYKQR